MPDYTALLAEWEAVLERRRELGQALDFWTAVLEGWRSWDDGAVEPLVWRPEECLSRWTRGVPLMADAVLELEPASLEDLLGPIMERLAVGSPGDAEALRRFAEAWDGGRLGPTALLPTSGKDGVAVLQEEVGLPAHLAGFLSHAGLRPALERFLSGTRALPEGAWDRGSCPWCGGLPGWGDVGEDGRRRLSCHLCGGTWIAPRLRCPFCETWHSSDMVRLVAEGAEEGYFVEACRSCRGYLKGVDRRQRWNAGAPVVEDWASPHLDVYATRQGFWRATPSLVHLLPPEGGPAA
jgi:hypothetical protein